MAEEMQIAQVTLKDLYANNAHIRRAFDLFLSSLKGEFTQKGKLGVCSKLHGRSQARIARMGSIIDRHVPETDLSLDFLAMAEECCKDRPEYINMLERSLDIAAGNQLVLPLHFTDKKQYIPSITR